MLGWLPSKAEERMREGHTGKVAVLQKALSFQAAALLQTLGGKDISMLSTLEIPGRGQGCMVWPLFHFPKGHT